MTYFLELVQTGCLILLLFGGGFVAWTLGRMTWDEAGTAPETRHDGGSGVTIE